MTASAAVPTEDYPAQSYYHRHNGNIRRAEERFKEKAMSSITKAQLENWFSHHAPTEEQVPRFQAIRNAGLILAEAIVINTPPSADQSAAVRLVREAVMTANASIACNGE